MNPRALKYTFLSLILMPIGMLAQTGVSINSTGTAPNTSAILDVSSTTKGALLPRMTSAERIALVPTGVSGMTVFDTTTQSYWYWDGVANIWKQIPNTTGNTLDAAYDAGGAGLGRTITADAGNVAIQGAGSLTVAANVGIGTTAPSEKLELEFSGRGGILLDGDNTQDAFIQFDNGGSSNYIYTDQSDNNNLKLEAGTGKEVAILSDGANERMVVQSDGRVRVNNLADANSSVVITNPAGVLGKRPLTGNATDVLLGTGVFGPASAFEDDDWYKSGTTVAPQSISDNIYKLGTVAIGANITASAPLQVQAAGAGNPANNAILVNNPTNSVGQDAIVTARVAGSAAGDPFFSMDISGEAGWSLGVDNDHANRFKVAPSWSNLSSSTALTIKTDGNVGVATDDPDQKLQVNGVIRSRGAGMIDMDAVNAAGPRVAWGTTTNVYEYMNMGAYNSMNQIETTTRDFRIGSNAATNAIYVQNANGNVGMGTNTPDANLNVGNPAGATIYLTREDNVTTTNEVLGSLLFDSTDDTAPSTTDGSAAIRGIASQDHGNSNKGAHLTFLTKNNVGSGTSATERMRIQADGNIGIGSTAPSFKLHLGVGSGDGLMIGNHNDQLGWNGAGIGPDLSIRFAGYRDVVNNFAGAKIAGIRTNLCCSGLSQGMELAFYTQEGTATGSGDGNLAERLRIGNGGNVGIGIAVPVQKLHVVGNARISGLSAGGNVQANASGDLIISNDIPGGDGDYIQNQNATAQSANYWITGTANSQAGYTSTSNPWGTSNSAFFPNGITTAAATNWIYGSTNYIGNAPSNGYGHQFNAASGNSSAWLAIGGGNVGIGTMTPGFKLHVPSGYIGTDYLNTTDNSVGSGVSGIMVKAGDNYLRTGTAAAVATFLNSSIAPNYANLTGIPLRTNWSGVHRNFVAEQLSWKNYGNNHTIFDASASTSPQGGAVNNTNPAVPWSATYPTLMGWNGSSTYGVRVDVARYAESAPGDNLGNHTATTTLNMNGSAITNAAEVYTNGWFRNNTGALGLYNQATGNHWYSESSPYWNIGGNNGTNTGIIFRAGYQGAVQGYVYSDGSGFGLLHNAGGWNYRNWNGGQEMYGQTLAGWSGLYANIMYDRDNSGYYVDPHSNTYINSFQNNNTLLGWPGYNGMTQAYGHYVWPGRNDGSGAWWQQSWYLAGNSSYGLYTNTGMYFAGGTYHQNGGSFGGSAYTRDWGDASGTSYGKVYSNWDNQFMGGIAISDDGGFYDRNDAWLRFCGSRGVVWDGADASLIMAFDMNDNGGLHDKQVFTTNANWGYMGTSGNYWYQMWSGSFNNGSRREWKRDITPVRDGLYELVMEDIDKIQPSFYKYNEELDEYQEGMESKYRPNYHLGVIIDESPDYIQDNTFNGIDIYAIATMGLTGVKYNRQEIKEIKEAVGLENGSVRIQDFGTIEMNGNRMHVPFNDKFASKLSADTKPIVTLTSNKLDVQLAVASKDADGFTVIAKGDLDGLVVDYSVFAEVSTRPETSEKSMSPSLLSGLRIDQSIKDKINVYWDARNKEANNFEPNSQATQVPSETENVVPHAADPNVVIQGPVANPDENVKKRVDDAEGKYVPTPEDGPARGGYLPNENPSKEGAPKGGGSK